MPYLPPVVVQVTSEWDATGLNAARADLSAWAGETYSAKLSADDSQLAAKVAAAQAALASFAKSVANATLSANDSLLAGKISAAEAAITAYGKTVGNAHLSATDAPLAAKIAAAEAALRAYGRFTENAHLGADLGNIAKEIAAAKLEMAGFARVTEDAHMAANYKDVTASITAAKTELADFAKTLYNAKLSGDTSPLWAKIAALRTDLARMSPLEVNVDANLTRALAELQILKGDYATMRTTDYVTQVLTNKVGAGAAVQPVTQVGGGTDPSLVRGVLAAMATLLGVGRDGTATHFGITLPKAGTLLSFAGLSIDHALITTLSLAGTATAGLLGGTVKALASGLVAAIGAGSSALVGSSTVADTQAMYKLLSQNDKLSLQDVTKTIGLPVDAGTQAEYNNAQALIALNAYWDAATNSGRVAASNFYKQFLAVAQTYIPKINAAATTNFKILSEAVKPLIQWLDSMGTIKDPGGLRIFQQMEALYSKNLPTVINTFAQGFEAVLKTLDWVATDVNTGKALKDLQAFFTSLNESISGQTVTGKYKNINVKGTISTWVADFNALWGFIKSVFSAAYNLFSGGKDQHTGQAIFTELTGFLNQLVAFEKSAAGTADIKNVFAVHKAEILSILQVLPPLFKALGGLYITIAPDAVGVATKAIQAVVAGLNVLVKALGQVAKIPDVGKTIVGIGGLFTILALRSKALQTGLAGVATAIGNILAKAGGAAGGALGTILTKIGGALGGGKVSLPAAVSEFGGFVKQFGGYVTKFGTEGGPGGLGGKGGKGAATDVEDGVKDAAPSLAGAIASKLGPIFTKGLSGVATNAALVALPAEIAVVLGSITRTNPATKTNVTAHPVGNQYGTPTQIAAFELAMKQAADTGHAAERQTAQLTNLEKTLVNKVQTDFATKGKTSADDYAKGYINAMTSYLQQFGAISTKSASEITTSFDKALGNRSPSKISKLSGENFMQGFVNGVKEPTYLNQITAQYTKIKDVSASTFKSFDNQMYQYGENAMAQLAAGITAGASQVNTAISNAVSAAASKAESELLNNLKQGMR